MGIITNLREIEIASKPNFFEVTFEGILIFKTEKQAEKFRSEILKMVMARHLRKRGR